MSLALVHSRSLDGLSAPPVRVEVQLANGLPSFTLVGLAETEVKESRERVRAAIQESGYAFPHNKRITVNLAPADLPKDSGRFDLPIALGILAAAGEIEAARLEGFEFAGELSLAGELKPLRGALALAMAVQRDGAARALVLPRASARMAAQVAGVRVHQAGHLAEVVQALRPQAEDATTVLEAVSHAAVPPGDGGSSLDLRDVRGQVLAKRALEVAAAGGHSLLLIGPPGTGKSMLAQRLATLLPPMEAEEALTSAALLGLASVEQAGFGRRPMRSPHHSASMAALVGGGSPPRPGEISLAHGGVLFLDEMAEMPRSVLDALREPLETGRITISRAARQAQFPARFQLVAAMNPCPCGWLGSPANSGRACRCTPDQVVRYRSRLSGPLLDRIDLRIEVQPIAPAELMALPQGESSGEVAARVAAARERALQRQGMANGLIEAAQIERHARLDAPAALFLRGAAERLAWSARRVHRTIKVARTIADLAGAETIEVAAVAEALQLQRGIDG